MLFVNLLEGNQGLLRIRLQVFKFAKSVVTTKRPVIVYLYISIVVYQCPAFFLKKIYLPKKPSKNLPYCQSRGKKGLFYEITGGLKPKSGPPGQFKPVKTQNDFTVASLIAGSSWHSPTNGRPPGWHSDPIHTIYEPFILNICLTNHPYIGYKYSVQ
jgi:hypothetical protein